MIGITSLLAQVGEVLFCILRNTDNRAPAAGLSPAHGIKNFFLQFPALILPWKISVNFNPFTYRSPKVRNQLILRNISKPEDIFKERNVDKNIF